MQHWYAYPHQGYQNEGENQRFDQLMKLTDQRKNQKKHQVDDRIYKKPADEEHFPAFRRTGLIVHVSG